MCFEALTLPSAFVSVAKGFSIVPSPVASLPSGDTKSPNSSLITQPSASGLSEPLHVEAAPAAPASLEEPELPLAPALPLAPLLPEVPLAPLLPEFPLEPPLADVPLEPLPAPKAPP